jgi:biotin operon repressor
MSEPTHLENRRRGRGRHPLLKTGSLTGDVYRHLKMNPDQTIAQVHSVLKGNRQSINAAIQRLKAEGLVIQVPMQKGNRVINPYRAVLENETSFARDRVEIVTTIFVNDFGEYSAVSRVTNEAPGARAAPGTHPVHTVTHYAAVPRSTETFKTRQIFDPKFRDSASDFSEGPIIDVEPNKD